MQDTTIVDEQELSMIEVASAVLRWRRAIITCACFGAAAGIALGLSSTREYVSSATFIPQVANEQTASAGLALAASQFGIRVANGGGGWPAATYVELLNSRGLLEPIARDILIVVEKGNQRLAMMDLLAIEDASPAIRVEKTIRKLRTLISAVEVKKLGAVQLTITTQWPSVSLAIAEKLIGGINRFNTQTRQSQASAERQFVDGRVREAELALREAEDQMQAFLQRNRVAVSPDLMFDRDRLQREITLRQQAYTGLLQSREEARIREVRDTPVITVLERPALPMIGESRQTASKAAMGALLGIFFALMWKGFGSARQSSNVGLREFFDAVDAALPRFGKRRPA